jgi:hypothetical protein
LAYYNAICGQNEVEGVKNVTQLSKILAGIAHIRLIDRNNETINYIIKILHIYYYSQINKFFKHTILNSFYHAIAIVIPKIIQIFIR